MMSLDKPADLALFLESADGLVLLFGQGQIGLKPELTQMIVDHLRGVDDLVKVAAALEAKADKLQVEIDQLTRKVAVLEAFAGMIVERW